MRSKAALRSSLPLIPRSALNGWKTVMRLACGFRQTLTSKNVISETGPLYATSANAHGKPPGKTVADILADLDGAPDYVADGGRLVGVNSTVVNFNADPPRVERWGAVDDLTAYGLGHA